MNYLPNESHVRRALQDYMGPWAGEIQQLLSAYIKLSEDHRRLKEACLDIVESEGDIKNVHVSHRKFSAFVDAVGK